MEETNKSQRCEEFSEICKFLLEIYPEFQLYGKTIEWIKGQEGMDMGWRT